MKAWRAFMDKYYPEGDKLDGAAVFGYGAAAGMVQVLKQAGDDLTRENIMKQAANLDFEIGIYLPGSRIKTSPTDFAPIEQTQLMKFEGEKWHLFGKLIDSHVDR
jgi:branched-chain amino acid transport system substrate-binding protein